MSTWKRVLTTDDTASISNTNLATNDLAQNATTRTYTLPTSSVSSSLQFKGNVDGNTETMLRIECDSDQAEPTQSYVYTPRLTIGNYSLSGSGSANGYSMPQFDPNVNQGEVMVSDNFDTNSGEMSFKTFDEWMNCNPQGPGFQGSGDFQPNGCQPRADYMLAWDDTVDQYQPIKLSELQKVMGYRTAYNFGRSGMPKMKMGVHKSRSGGLTTKGVAAYRRANPGSKLKTAVTESNPKGKRAGRRKSFCSRMCGMKKRLTSAKTSRDPNSRINKALRKWRCRC
jgi:hypothetical protein